MARSSIPTLRPLVIATALLLPLLAGCGGDAPPDADPSLDPRQGSGPAEGAARDSDSELPEDAQARSLFGDVLFAPPLAEELEEQRESNLAEALAERDRDPDDAENWIWVGRHQAYLGEYRDAIETFGEGWDRFPDDPRFLRHRGHRRITLRDFPGAIEDLTLGIQMAGDRMDETEPDGLPNSMGIPLTTLGFNLWYHRALAEYLSGDLQAARESWESTLAVSDNPDLQVAARYWLHLTLRKLGEDDEARVAIEPVNENTEVIENGSYRDLILLFRGLRTPAQLLDDQEDGLTGVTLLYGIAMHHLIDGDETEGRALLQQILDRPDQWPAFGYVAAEAELAAMGRTDGG